MDTPKIILQQLNYLRRATSSAVEQRNIDWWIARVTELRTEAPPVSVPPIPSRLTDVRHSLATTEA
jgi:hypothetical protein